MGLTKAERMKRKLKITIILVIIAIFLYLFSVYQNNRDIPELDKQILNSHLEKSILWLVNNKDKIIHGNELMLWWMLYEAHKISKNRTLAILLDEFFYEFPQIKMGLWSPLYDGRKHPNIDAYTVSNLSYYYQHIIYALHCADKISRDIPLVAQQNNATFCHQKEYFYRPACITHQLMGINFLKQNSCGINNIDDIIENLQQDIIGQLTWDIRVIDVYLQRVMMLLMTGAQDSVKPIWIKMILRQQLNDGGWGDFDEIVNLWDKTSIGFSSKVFAIGTEKSSFHATAQGIYLLTMLTYKE